MSAELLALAERQVADAEPTFERPQGGNGDRPLAATARRHVTPTVSFRSPSGCCSPLKLAIANGRDHRALWSRCRTRWSSTLEYATVEAHRLCQSARHQFNCCLVTVSLVAHNSGQCYHFLPARFVNRNSLRFFTKPSLSPAGLHAYRW